MPKSADAYRLVIFDPPPDPHAVRDLICEATGRHPTDVMQWVARSPGVWPQPLAEREVRAILDGLYELGIAAEARRAEALPKLAPSQTVHDLSCSAEGVRALGLRGEARHWIPWDKLELVAAGRVEQPDELRVIAPPTWVNVVRTGLNALLQRPSIIARRERSMRIERPAIGEAILVRRDPLLALRVSEPAMNYASLGPRKRPIASENFRLILAEVCARSDSAYLTPSTRALLGLGARPDPDIDSGPDPEPPDDSPFASSSALLDYAAHRLLWAWYRRDREAESPTET